MIDTTPQGPVSSPLRVANETALPMNSRDPLGLIEQPIGMEDDGGFNSLQVHLD